MKIKKFNENTTNVFDIKNIADTKLVDDKVNTLTKYLQNTIRDIMNINGDIIILGEIRIVDPFHANTEDGHLIYSIDADAVLENYDKSIGFYIHDIINIHDLKLIISTIVGKKEQTYLYQKFLIENKSDEIKTIKNFNAKIIKEYPFVKSGTDLNLL